MSSRFEAFLSLSVELTAFSHFDLLGTGLAERYLDTLDKVVGGEIVDALLAAFAALPPPEGEARIQAVRTTILGNELLGDVARALIKLWYSGTWFGLSSAWTERFGPRPANITFVVSPDAYVEGLLWKAIGVHPAGAKGPGFGSWAFPPKIPAIPGLDSQT
ncbi:hypothetical protein [Rhizobium laguerreae]|uniref:hypothetical protein n=1 Tax=Rhizobium laguerreae TaxID=1076926 RepID=UPI001C90C096|nr:hypothetical protein [Rhizobium laguerreae]MBY3348888.1 hypothetical protein [Rhizobium laguerreae]MBY3355889.1 hypothetical protein [Rhizobium laguerreae]MBY3369914.1 hypothetical protein [Rhizobium laguerreae]MBY3377041.1 hypothetical protein [Rhizobium laguerreae]MBY3390781.1 hypothetical protein [Rhizobium laguerreae]